MATAGTKRMPGRGAAGSELTPEAARVLRQFRVLFNSVRRHFRAVESRAGVSGALLWALRVVDDHPGIGVNDLAAAMDVHQSAMSNLLRRRRAEGLVVDKRSEVDRRALHLYITKEGRHLLRKAPRPYSGVLPDALLALDPRALKRLHRDLDDPSSARTKTARTRRWASHGSPR